MGSEGFLEQDVALSNEHLSAKALLSVVLVFGKTFEGGSKTRADGSAEQSSHSSDASGRPAPFASSEQQGECRRPSSWTILVELGLLAAVVFAQVSFRHEHLEEPVGSVLRPWEDVSATSGVAPFGRLAVAFSAEASSIFAAHPSEE